jgi:cysteine desulfurase family protein
VIYLDYAATSWPKPAACIRAIEHYMADIGCNPSYARHQMAIKGEAVIEEARGDVAWLLGVSEPKNIIFTLNATEALNRVLCGFLKPGDRVLASRLEHCSVTRPLADLCENRGIKVERIGDKETGIISPDDIHEACEKKPARLLTVTHASNVTGGIQPIDKLASAAHEHGCAILVDTAQTAGVIPIRADKWGVDLLAFAGHKHLLGPMGVGGFYVRDPEHLKPVIVGSAWHSDSGDSMPDKPPQRYEAGTPNAPGIVGLGASCRAIREKGIPSIHREHESLTRHILAELKKVPGVKIYGPTSAKNRVGVISFNVGKIPPERVGIRLDKSFDIMVRTGLCSCPWAHEHLETLPDGAVRASLGYFTKKEEADLLIEAVNMIAAEGNGDI